MGNMQKTSKNTGFQTEPRDVRPPVLSRHTGQGGVGLGRQGAGGAQQAAATEIHKACDLHIEAGAQ